jgi:integrase
VKSERFPNIYQYPGRGGTWCFRKYSATRHKRFFLNTKEADEKRAFSVGNAAFEKWERATEEKAETFQEFAEVLLEKKLEAPIEDFSLNSRRSTQNSYRHLISAFGPMLLTEITDETWKDYVYECRREGPQKFFNRRKALIEILGRAFRRGKIKALPEIYHPDKDAPVGRFLSDFEVSALMNAASPSTALLIRIMYRQGPRPGEAIRYAWEMIDWERGQHGYLTIPGEITKTRRARSIPMHPEVSGELKLWRKRQEKRKTRSPYVFPSPGNPMRPVSEYKNGWRAACARVRLDATIYDLRRTFITLQVKAGVNKDQLAKYCDTSPAMIDRVYNQSQEDVFEQIAGWDVGANEVRVQKIDGENAWLQ